LQPDFQTNAQSKNPTMPARTYSIESSMWSCVCSCNGSKGGATEVLTTARWTAVLQEPPCSPSHRGSACSCRSHKAGRTHLQQTKRQAPRRTRSCQSPGLDQHYSCDDRIRNKLYACRRMLHPQCSPYGSIRRATHCRGHHMHIHQTRATFTSASMQQQSS
jgi:hypothetical protein